MSPAILEAIQEANVGGAAPYGKDPWTARAIEQLQSLLGRDHAEVFFTYGGTGANVLALQCLLRPHESVICSASAHLNTDEAGAPEKMVGCKLLGVAGADGKLTPEALRPLLADNGDRTARPRVLSITQSTESGTLYTLDELAALSELAHAHGLYVHVDGARLTNAAAALGCSLAQITAGADVVSFGGGKNGMMYGEAVVFLTPGLADLAPIARRGNAQAASKMRFIGAQFQALLTDELWLRNATHANAMATRLAEAVAAIPGVRVLRDPQVNSVFAQIPQTTVEPLQQWSFFWVWDAEQSVVRWMTSSATTPQDVDRFAAGVAYAVRQASA